MIVKKSKRKYNKIGDKMKLYDTHSDIMFNLYDRTLKHETDVFAKYHLNDLKAGNIKGGIWVVYSETDFDIIKAYDIALKVVAPYIDQFDVIYGLEGLRNVPNIEVLDALYQKGIRHASLTWNEENHFATGVAGPADHGLKDLGKEVIQYMNKHKMIIDVSHLNVKSFYDVLEEDPQILFASHSNAYTLSNHRRNLNDDQLKALKLANGYVGVNSARNFVSKDPKKQNLDGLIDQIIYLAEHLGLDHIMFGLDMMHFLSDYDNANLDDLTCYQDANQIEQKLLARGFSHTEIEMLAFKNYLKAIAMVERAKNE